MDDSVLFISDDELAAALNGSALLVDLTLLPRVAYLEKQYLYTGNPLLVYHAGRNIADLFGDTLDRKPYQLGCLHQFLGYLLLNASPHAEAIARAEAHLALALGILDSARIFTVETGDRYLRCLWLYAVSIKMRMDSKGAIDLITNSLNDSILTRNAPATARVPLIRQLVIMEQSRSAYQHLEKALSGGAHDPREYFHSVRRVFEFAVNVRDVQWAMRMYSETRHAFAASRHLLESVHKTSYLKNLYHYFMLIGEPRVGQLVFHQALASAKTFGLHGQRSQLEALALDFATRPKDDVRIAVAQFGTTQPRH